MSSTFSELQDAVLSNSFSTSRYETFVQRWLNDAVTDVCRRLKLHRGYEILDFASDGVVTQPAAPFFHVEELWWCDASATGSGEQAVRRYAQTKLEALPWQSTAGLRDGSQPIFYTARRKASPTTNHAEIEITVVPASSAGKVAVVGLQRPAVMSADDDESGLGADLDDALIAFAKSRCFRQEDDAEMTGFWRGEFEACLRSARTLPAQSDGPIITPGWGSDELPVGGQ